jgi:hypothetical protein
MAYMLNISVICKYELSQEQEFELKQLYYRLYIAIRPSCGKTWHTMPDGSMKDVTEEVRQLIIAERKIPYYQKCKDLDAYCVHHAPLI